MRGEKVRTLVVDDPIDATAEIVAVAPASSRGGILRLVRVSKVTDRVAEWVHCRWLAIPDQLGVPEFMALLRDGGLKQVGVEYLRPIENGLLKSKVALTRISGENGARISVGQESGFLYTTVPALGGHWVQASRFTINHKLVQGSPFEEMHPMPDSTGWFKKFSAAEKFWKRDTRAFDFVRQGLFTPLEMLESGAPTIAAAGGLPEDSEELLGILDNNPRSLSSKDFAKAMVLKRQRAAGGTR